MKTFELTPTNGRKSFYKKAIVEQDNEMSYLMSYGTKVAHYNHDTNKMIVNRCDSQTTAAHINAFLDFYGFDKCTKKQLENYNK